MPTKQAFLFQEINKILRNCQKDELASLRYYSEKNIQDLENDGYLEKGCLEEEDFLKMR